MKVYIPKKYRNRHKLLSMFFLLYNSKYSPDLMDLQPVSLLFSSVADKSNLTDEEVSAQLDYLKNEGEIASFERNYSEYYYITQKGKIALTDNKYIAIGKREFWNDNYDIIKVISAVILLAIALISFIVNLLETKENSKQIDILKQEVLKIKDTTKTK